MIIREQLTYCAYQKWSISIWFFFFNIQALKLFEILQICFIIGKYRWFLITTATILNL